LKEKRKKERQGNNPEIEKLNKEKDAYKAERQPVLDQIIQLENQVKGPKEQISHLKAEKENLQKEIEFYKVEHLDAEIKTIQHKLGFSSLSVSEEKKLIDRKNRIESQRTKVARYAEVVKLMKTIHDSNDQIFTKLKALNESKKHLNDKVKTLSTKLKNYIDSRTQNEPVIKNIELQIENIKEEKKKNIQKKYEINQEYYDKLNRYHDQQKLLAYIKEAEEKISQLKKKEEREKKRKEREEKENASNQIDSVASTVKVEEDPFAYEISTCEWLSNYFKNLIGVKDAVPTTEANKQNTNAKIDEDLSKGLLKPVVRKDDNLFIGLSTSEAPKKKVKGPKVSKREQAALSSGLLSLDISIIKKIQDVKLSPPTKRSDVIAFIELLQKNINDFKNQAQAKQTPSQESQTKVEESKPQEVNEIKVEKQVDEHVNLEKQVVQHVDQHVNVEKQVDQHVDEHVEVNVDQHVNVEKDVEPVVHEVKKVSFEEAKEVHTKDEVPQSQEETNTASNHENSETPEIPETPTPEQPKAPKIKLNKKVTIHEIEVNFF
jgi:hypothetical protein